MLARRPLFTADSAEEMLRQQVQDKPTALGRLCPQAPAGLVRVIERCLAKDPEHRYADYRTLLQDLDRVTVSPAAAAPAKSSSAERDSTVSLVTALAVVVALVGGGIWYGTRRRPEPPPAPRKVVARPVPARTNSVVRPPPPVIEPMISTVAVTRAPVQAGTTSSGGSVQTAEAEVQARCAARCQVLQENWTALILAARFEEAAALLEAEPEMPLAAAREQINGLRAETRCWCQWKQAVLERYRRAPSEPVSLALRTGSIQGQIVGGDADGVILRQRFGEAGFGETRVSWAELPVLGGMRLLASRLDLACLIHERFGPESDCVNLECAGRVPPPRRGGDSALAGGKRTATANSPERR